MKSRKYFIPLIYIAVGIAWIMISDKAIVWLLNYLPGTTMQWSMLKGSFFIVVTGLLLYILIKKLELKIQDNLHLEDTLNSISDSFFTVNKKWVITKANRNFYERTGIAQDVVGKPVDELFPNVERTSIYQHAKKSMDERIPTKVQEYYGNLNKWLRVSCYPTKEGIAVYFTDISQEKQQEIELKLALERYDLASKATGDVIYDQDILTGKMVFTDHIKALTQLPPKEIGNTLAWWRRRVHPDDLAILTDSYSKNVKNKVKQWQAEYRILLPDGTSKFVCDQCYLVLDPIEKPIRIIGCIKDIDLIKRHAYQIKRLGEILDKIHNPVVISSPEGKITWTNAAFVGLSGYSEEECLGKKHSDLLFGPKTDQDTVSQLLAAVEKRQSYSAELQLYTKEKTEYWVSINLTPLFNDSGELESYISVENDITERKDKEAKIGKQSAQLETLSWLNSHQIRKPVASILSLITLIKSSEDNSERQHLLEVLCECTEELDKIIHRINSEASANK